MEFSTLEELLVKLVCSVEFPVNQSNSETGDQLNVGSIKLTGLDHRLGGGSDQLKAEMLLENGEIKRLFLKIKKKGSWLEDFEKTFHIFEKEMFMYQNLLPEMSRFQLHHSGKHSVANLFPKFYGSGYVKEDLYLVFEDILTDNTNFRVTNKIEFHTIPQIELALTKLGVFHAVGYAMKFSGIKFSEKYPELKEQLWNPVNREQGIFRTEQREWLDGLLLLITSVLEENAKGNPVLAKTGFKTSLSADKMDAVRKYSRNCAEITELAMLPVEPLAVLTHGDFHMWNMAFHTNMREIKLFDLQVARYSSPAVDIIQ